tara:strand:+ start:53 stop:565 length:513 start_codon:yes stop_codon:yes gene_type:complete
MKHLKLEDFFSDDIRNACTTNQTKPKLTVDFTGRFSFNAKLIQEYTERLDYQEVINATLGARSPYYFSVIDPVKKGSYYTGVISISPERFEKHGYPVVNINDKGTGSKIGVANFLVDNTSGEEPDLEVDWNVERKVGKHTATGWKLTFYPTITGDSMLGDCLTFPMFLYS